MTYTIGGVICALLLKKYQQVVTALAVCVTVCQLLLDNSCQAVEAFGRQFSLLLRMFAPKFCLLLRSRQRALVGIRDREKNVGLQAARARTKAMLERYSNPKQVRTIVSKAVIDLRERLLWF